MKFRVTMKDPDTLGDAIREAAIDEVNAIQNLDEDEREDVITIREEKINDLCKQWFQYGEYLTVEIDTDAETITVCEAA